MPKQEITSFTITVPAWMRRAIASTAAAIARPDAGRQAVFRIVGQADGFVVALEGHHRQDRAKGLFAHDAHLVGDIGQHGRGVKVWADLRQTLSARQDARSLRPGVFHLRFDIQQLALVDQRSDVDLGIHAVAHSQRSGVVRTGLEKWRIQAAMHIATLDRQTGLPGVDESTPDRASRRDFNVGILEHQHRIFAAQFENNGQQAHRRSLRNLLTRGHASGKDQLVDGGIDQRRSRRAVAGDHLKDFLGHAGLMQQRYELNAQ